MDKLLSMATASHTAWLELPFTPRALKRGQSLLHIQATHKIPMTQRTSALYRRGASSTTILSKRRQFKDFHNFFITLGTEKLQKTVKHNFATTSQVIDLQIKKSLTAMARLFSNLLPMKLESSFGVTVGRSLLHPRSVEPMQFIQP